MKETKVDGNAVRDGFVGLFRAVMLFRAWTMLASLGVQGRNLYNFASDQILQKMEKLRKYSLHLLQFVYIIFKN
jgi:hypothetical protein